MGQYISWERCQSQYDVKLNCSVGTFDQTSQTWSYIGNSTRGTFQGNADIAGILGVYMAVTCFALLLSALNVFWQWAKNMGWKKTKNNGLQLGSRGVSDILEAMVVACSDQQIFTGAAYALTLRYWDACTISAYHYNIVANMLLLSCATHLMSVTIVRNYWKYPFLAFLRVLCVSGVFLVTGLLMANQNAIKGLPFPTGIPAQDETDSFLFLNAACFEDPNTELIKTLGDSTSSAKQFFEATLKNSTPDRNKITGWNWYVLILLFYGAAIVAEIARFIRRGRARPGWRGNLGMWVERKIHPTIQSCSRYLVGKFFLLYLAAGVGIGCVVVVSSGRYIFGLRGWVAQSGWMEKENGKNPEDDATTFGQLVPIFTSGLVIFSFLQTISEKVTEHGNRKYEDDEKPPQGGTIDYLDPSQYDLIRTDNMMDTAYKGAIVEVKPSIVDPEAQVSAQSPKVPMAIKADAASNREFQTETPLLGRSLESMQSSPRQEAADSSLVGQSTMSPRPVSPAVPRSAAAVYAPLSQHSEEALESDLGSLGTSVSSSLRIPRRPVSGNRSLT